MKLSNSALWVLITSAKLTVMTGSIIVPVINVMRDAFDVDPASAGFIITTHALFAALSYPVFRNLVSIKGPKKLLVAGLLLYGVAGGSGLFITSFELLLVSRAILGMSFVAVMTSVTAILNMYTQEERKALMGLRGASTGFGSINWPIVGGFLGVFSWHLPFAVYLLTIPLGLFLLKLLPEIAIEHKGEGEPKDSVHKRNDKSVIICGFTLLENSLLFTILVFVPQILEKIGISFPFFISFFIIIIMISRVFGELLYGKITFLSHEMVILFTLGLWAVGFAATPMDTGVVIAGILILFGIGQGLSTPVIGRWANAAVDGDKINVRMRIFGFIGQFLAPLVFFPVVLVSGITEVFLAAGIVCAVLFVIFLGILLLSRERVHEYS